MKGMLVVLFVSVAVSFVNAYTIADAERAYVAKDWKTAKLAYAEVCKTLKERDAVRCSYWYALALSQSGNGNDFRMAGQKIDSLIKIVNPGDSLYSDLVMTRAQFEIYLKKFIKAKSSLRHAIETSLNPQGDAMLQVCQMLQNADKSKETEKFCDSLKNGTLVPKILPDVNALNAVDSSKNVVNLTVRDSLVTDSTTEKAVEKKLETYALQVGAFGKKENAEMFLSALKSRDVEVRVVERISDDRVLYLVQTLPFDTKALAVEYGENVLKPLNIEFTPVKNP